MKTGASGAMIGAGCPGCGGRVPLVRGSYVPARPARELRELTRYRTALVHERSDAINRVHKTLEGANIKLSSVASDLMGKSGRQMLAALAAGTTDAGALADLAK